MQAIAPGAGPAAGVGLDLEDVVRVHLQPHNVHEGVRDIQVLLVDGISQFVVGDLVHLDVPVAQVAGRQVPGQSDAGLRQTRGCEVLGGTRGSCKDA